MLPEKHSNNQISCGRRYQAIRSGTVFSDTCSPEKVAAGKAEVDRIREGLGHRLKSLRE